MARDAGLLEAAVAAASNGDSGIGAAGGGWSSLARSDENVEGSNEIHADRAMVMIRL